MQQLPHIDGFRAFLTLSVMTTHYTIFFANVAFLPDEGPVEERVWRAWFSGHSHSIFVNVPGVDLFFIMAGFFTVWAEREGEQLKFVAQLWSIVAKCGRIFPFYWLSNLIFIALRRDPGRPLPPHRMGFEQGDLTKLLLVFSGTQSWFPVWRMGRYLPMLYNGPCWFVSSLMGCFVIYGLFGPPLLRFANTVTRNIVLVIVFCALRNAIAFVGQAHSPLQGLTSHVFPGHVLESSHQGWLYHWPPSCALPFFAGAFTARLVKLLPSDSGVRTWRVWMFGDLLFIIIAVVGSHWCIGDNNAPNGMTALARVRGTDQCEWSSNQIHLFGCVLLFCACCKHKGLFLRSCGHPCLVALAPLSFHAYLFHFLTIIWMLKRGWSAHSVWSISAFYVLNWFFAGIAASFIEAPLRTWLKEWKSRSNKNATSSSSEYAPAVESMCPGKKPTEETPLRRHVV